MSEILFVQDRVRNTIQLGESHFREFKSALQGQPDKKNPRPINAIREDIARTLVAFANADGGELLIGVEDDGTISGVPHLAEDIQKMLKAPSELTPAGSKLPSLLQYATKLDLGNKIVIFFSISKGTEEIYCTASGAYYRRKDTESVPLVDIEQVKFERAEIRSREYDREFVDGATIYDLNLEWIWPLARAMTKRTSGKPSAGDLAEPSVERFLQQMGLAEFTAIGGLRLRRAALILFAQDTFRWYLRSEVRIMKVFGTERKSGEHYNVLSDSFVTGNVFQLLIDTWERLKNAMVVKTEFGPDARFEQKYMYPELTCREALINAIVHRDYISQNPIEISLFDDRLEIKSPGALLSNLTLENLEQLQGAHESRNVLIARVLRENKYVRELGEGVRRMFESMEENNLDRPKLQSNHYSFSVTLFHKPVFDEPE